MWDGICSSYHECWGADLNPYHWVVPHVPIEQEPINNRLGQDGNFYRMASPATLHDYFIRKLLINVKRWRLRYPILAIIAGFTNLLRSNRKLLPLLHVRNQQQLSRFASLLPAQIIVSKLQINL